MGCYNNFTHGVFVHEQQVERKKRELGDGTSMEGEF
jgi:hypothetical protein